MVSMLNVSFLEIRKQFLNFFSTNSLINLRIVIIPLLKCQMNRSQMMSKGVKDKTSGALGGVECVIDVLALF